VVKLVREDMALARELYARVSGHPELEAGTCGLSITTFRYVPPGVRVGSPEGEEYLNRLNLEVVTRLQRGGEAFLSNAVVRGRYLLRACVVNFRTNRRDVAALPELVVRVGREASSSMEMEAAPGAR
jgi:glutamate/tyrosine decarboxylase-like PLP-dependent enzyme